MTPVQNGKQAIKQSTGEITLSMYQSYVDTVFNTTTLSMKSQTHIVLLS